MVNKLNKIELNNNIKEITNIFSENFYEIYSFMEKNIKLDILSFVPTLFRKWYQAAIVEETILSPNNIISISDEINNIIKNNEDSVFTINILIDNNKKGIEKFKYEGILYNIENHPIIYDLKKIYDICCPNIEVDSSYNLKKETLLEISNVLSLKDIFYTEYLFNILKRFNLVKKIPSIYSYKIAVSNNIETFFNNDNEKILNLIINESIKICSEKISEILNINDEFTKLVDFNIIYSLLKNTIPVDEIFEQIYSSLGIDINEIWESSEKKELTQYDTAILSSTFYIGIIIDKYFISVFSEYLKVIETFYSSCINFKNSINTIAEIITLKKDVGFELFSPCSYYKLTSLGKKLIKNYSDNNNINEIPNKFQFDEIKEAILFEHNQLKILKSNEIKKVLNKKIYEFKLEFLDNKELWKIIEVSENLNLEEFGNEICICFGFEDITDFSFKINDNNGFPVEYISKFSKRPALNKTEKYKLKNININIEKEFIFIPTLQNELCLKIKCSGIYEENTNIIYPRIKYQSEKISEIEQDLELI